MPVFPNAPIYDDFGNRVSETVGGVTTLYLTDTQNPTGYDQPLEAKNSATSKLVMTYLLGDRDGIKGSHIFLTHGGKSRQHYRDTLRHGIALRPVRSDLQSRRRRERRPGPSHSPMRNPRMKKGRDLYIRDPFVSS